MTLTLCGHVMLPGEAVSLNAELSLSRYLTRTLPKWLLMLYRDTAYVSKMHCNEITYATRNISSLHSERA